MIIDIHEISTHPSISREFRKLLKIISIQIHFRHMHFTIDILHDIFSCFIAVENSEDVHSCQLHLKDYIQGGSITKRE